MNYELAKELKEAGFPQGIDYERGDKEFVDGTKNPTLSELIEACGEEFCSLTHIPNNSEYSWEVEGRKYKVDKVGSTPSEAVARLWLALQTNK